MQKDLKLNLLEKNTMFLTKTRIHRVIEEGISSACLLVTDQSPSDQSWGNKIPSFTLHMATMIGAESGQCQSGASYDLTHVFMGPNALVVLCRFSMCIKIGAGGPVP